MQFGDVGEGDQQQRVGGPCEQGRRHHGVHAVPIGVTPLDDVTGGGLQCGHTIRRGSRTMPGDQSQQWPLYQGTDVGVSEARGQGGVGVDELTIESDRQQRSGQRSRRINAGICSKYARGVAGDC